MTAHPKNCGRGALETRLLWALGAATVAACSTSSSADIVTPDAATLDALAIDAVTLDAPAIDAVTLDAPAIDARTDDLPRGDDTPRVDASYDVGIDARPTWPEAPAPALVRQLVATPRYGNVYGGGPLGDALWTGASWVVSGVCDQYMETGGLWTFDGAGAPLGRSNVCTDALAEGQDANGLQLWAHQYDVGSRLSVVSPSRVLKAGASNAIGWPFPLVMYDVDAGSRLASRAFALLVAAGGASMPPATYQRDDAPVHRAPVVFGARVLAVSPSGPVAAPVNTLRANAFVPLRTQWRLSEFLAVVGRHLLVRGWPPGGRAPVIAAFTLEGDDLVAGATLDVGAVDDARISVDGTRVGLLDVTPGAARVVVFESTASGLRPAPSPALPIAALVTAGGPTCGLGLLGPFTLVACRQDWRLFQNEAAVALPARPPSDDAAPVRRVAFAPDGRFVLVRADGAWLYRM